MTRGPYRERAGKEAPTPPKSLELWLRDGDKNAWFRRVFVKVNFTGVVCAFVAQSRVGLAAIPIAIAGLLWAIQDIRARRGARVVLTVDGGTLHVARGAEGPLEIDLDALDDVRLDTKSSSKSITVARADGVNTVFGMASGHSVEVDVSRIELCIDEEPLLLDEEFVSSILCTESLRRVRLFLRAHGWRPIDERGEEETIATSE